METALAATFTANCLPADAQRHVTQAALVHFTVNGFSAGSYTGAVIALAIRCLWPTCQITARLGAIAMPKGVLAALIATADPDKHQEASCHRARHASAIPAHHVRGRLSTLDGQL